MADEDCAILVGINRYRDPGRYPTLNGPLNDVQRIHDWLTSAGGGALKQENVHLLKTPAELLALADQQDADDTEWSPNREQFSRKFKRLTLDKTGEFVRRESRLYLYFSGHGFSQHTDAIPSAALYGADNVGKDTSNLAGTLYAQAAKRALLFREVVLIMDCCRDTESNVDYSPPDLNKVENPGAENVKVMAIYAAPKRGKAQERELAEADGLTVGLLTNAWLKALREAPCDVLGRVPGKGLMAYIELNWKKWYGEPTPPVPRAVFPENGDIHFASGKPLVTQSFDVPPSWPPQTPLHLMSSSLMAIGGLEGEKVVWRDAANNWQVSIPLVPTAGGGRTFQLTLSEVPHNLLVDGQAPRAFMPGGPDAVAL